MNTGQYPSSFFQREDTSADRVFYGAPRRVVHIDEAAIATLTGIYAELLPASGRILDLMSSWRSHLPAALGGKHGVSVTGLGMNAQEMQDNPQLTGHAIHDLNEDPRLPFRDMSFDAAVCAVSVQYMVRPIEVFTDLARVLKPGAPCIVSFSNRCFPTKAVSVWLNSTADQHLALVSEYFTKSGKWGEVRTRAHEPIGRDPLYVAWAARA